MKTLRTVQLLAVVLCAAAVVPTFAADGDLDVAWNPQLRFLGRSGPRPGHPS